MNRIKFNIKPVTILLLLLCGIAVVMLPKSLTGYSLMVVNTGLMFIIVSFGLSLMLGMGGLLSFAGVAFMGGGAYFAANLSSGRLGFYLDTTVIILLAPIVLGVIAYLLGSILLKLKGTYFTFATIALVQVAFSFYQNYVPFFGGPAGISNISKLTIGSIRFDKAVEWFYLLVICVALVAFIIERIRRTQLGRSLAAIRDNDTAALTLGVNVYKTKVIAFTIAGMLAAFAGALYALHSGFIGSDMFTFERSTVFIIMAMVGGVNNTFGIIVGSLLITVLPEVMRGLQRYLQLIYGLAVIVMMVLMPMGLAGMGEAAMKWLKNKLKRKNGKPLKGREIIDETNS